ncbi:hypothetical protein Lal_00041881 [Lupinus albus]|nr:hypothetical protein Lal_00041881 [Lupinus albus]
MLLLGKSFEHNVMPSFLCLDKIQRRFLWAKGVENKSVHWLSWKKTKMQLLAPREFGEIEFGHGISNGEGDCFSGKKRNMKNF